MRRRGVLLMSPYIEKISPTIKMTRVFSSISAGGRLLVDAQSATESVSSAELC